MEELRRDEEFGRERLEEILKQIHASSGAWVKDRAAQRSAMVAQLRGLEERRRNLYDVLELQGRDAPNLGDMSPRLRELAARYVLPPMQSRQLRAIVSHEV